MRMVALTLCKFDYFTISYLKHQFMNKLFSVLTLTIISFTIQAQTTKFDNKEAFYPQFYPYPGNDYRSASGEPGPKNWQNLSD